MEDKNKIKIPLEKIILGNIRKEVNIAFSKIVDNFKDISLGHKIDHKISIDVIPEIKADIKFPETQKVSGDIMVNNLKDLPAPVVNVEKVIFPEMQKISGDVQVSNLKDLPAPIVKVEQNEVIVKTEKVEFPKLMQVEEINKQDIKSEFKRALDEVISEMSKDPTKFFNIRPIGKEGNKLFWENVSDGGGGGSAGAKNSDLATDFSIFNV